MLKLFTKEGLLKAYHTTTKHLSLLLIAILIGVAIGFKLVGFYVDYRIDESIKIQGFIYKGVIYDIKPRP